MLLQPLQQWICDTCGEIIEQPDHGYVEWVAEKRDELYVARDLRIVHHAPRSPHYRRETQTGHCYKHEHTANRCDLALNDFVGAEGLSRFLAVFFDVGPTLRPEFLGPQVADLRATVEIMRRLYVPYYEEARLYWTEAEVDGFMAGGNELALYAPDRLRELIARYGESAAE